MNRYFKIIVLFVNIGLSINSFSQVNKINNSKIDSSKSITTIISFLKWYGSVGFDTVKFRFYDEIASYGDTAFYFKVNYNGVMDYCILLKKSGLISDKFIESQNDYFKQEDSNLRQSYNDRKKVIHREPLALFNNEFRYLFQNLSDLSYKIYKRSDNYLNIEVKIRYGNAFYFYINANYLIDGIL